MSRKISLSEEQIKYICNLYDDGYSSIKISNECGLSSSYIRKVLKKHSCIREYNLKLDDFTIHKICSLYKDGYSSIYISNLLNIDGSTVLKYVNLHNVGVRTLTHYKAPKLNTNTQNIIISKYLMDSNIKLTDLQNELGISSQTISKCLKNNGITVNNLGSRKYFFDLDFFTKKDYKSSYFYGFCLGDGCIYKNDKYSRIQIQIHEKDKIILNTFCKWLGLSEEIIFSYKNKVGMFLTHEIFSNDYSKYGLVPNKTYNPIIPNINEIFIKPFIIGLIDADGTIRVNNKTKKYQRFGLTGNKKIIMWFEEVLRGIGYIGDIKMEFPEDKIWGRALIYKHDDIIQVFSLLQPENFFHLPRKWNQIQYQSI